jgi:prepilin-type N-terminal cleavage/methylation domain-containing protein
MSDRRGFTLMEVLVAIGVAAITLGILASAMRSQGRNTIFQTGTADMQQNVRGALALVRREVRLAGYGMVVVPPAALPPVEVPPGADQYRVVLRGNYDNARSRGSAAAGTTTVTLEVPAAFLPGERLAIESAVFSVAEVRTIASYDGAATVTVIGAFANDYEPGSTVQQINEVAYRLDDQNRLWRSWRGVDQIIADQMSALQMRYVVAGGALVDDPAASIATLRAATIRMHAERPELDGLQPQAELATEVRIRNLGIVREAS